MRTVDRGGAPGRAKVMKRFANIPVQVKPAPTTWRSPSSSAPGSSRTSSSASCRATSQPRRPMPPLVDGVTVMGPFNSPGVWDTPSRRRVFTCRPQGNDERACARRIAETLARRAFRRPVTAAEVESLMPYLEDGGEGARRIRRGHRAPDRRGAGEPRVPVSRDSGMGVRRSARLLRTWNWPRGSRSSSGARGRTIGSSRSRRRGGSTTPSVLRTEALRMLKDPRAEALVRNFALKALDLDKLSEVQPDPNLFPTFTKRCGMTWPARPVVRGEHPARGSQRRRSAHREPHVPQRAAGTPLRRHVCSDRSSAASRSTTRGAGACSARARCCCGLDGHPRSAISANSVLNVHVC